MRDRVHAAVTELACVLLFLGPGLYPLVTHALCFLLPDSFTSEFLASYSTLLFSLMQEALEPRGHLLKESAGLLQDVVGATASLNSALQSGIDEANKAGLFVFCVSSEMSWQFCNNREELHFSASPKYPCLAHQAASRVYTDSPLAIPHPDQRQAAKSASRYQRKLWILECETEGEGRPELGS